MADPESGDEKTGAEGPAVEAEAEAKKERPWLRPALAGAALLLVSGGIGFGLGLLAKSGDSAPDLSEREAFTEARTQAEEEVRREMARQGFDAGRRSGRDHGIIAGGMAAESDATILIRKQRAAQAQSEAAAAQSELSGMTAAPTPPTPAPGEDG